MKSEGVVLKNHFLLKTFPYDRFSIASGIINSKNLGLELPKKVYLKWMGLRKGGRFCPETADRIYINKISDKMCSTVVHETTHKNHKIYNKGFWRFLVPEKSFDMTMFNQNKALIKDKIRPYAGKNHKELVACIPQAFVKDGKTWSDFDPKIKELYEFYEGPKLNLVQ